MTELSAPRFPGLAGYRALAEGSARLGLRHVADLFATGEVPAGTEKDAAGLARFVVVDGFRLARPGNRWRRVDRLAVEEARTRSAERFGAAAGLADELLDLLQSALEEDSDVVRHVLLYQLTALATLRRKGGADTRRLLLDLGVHSDEVDEVCAMVGSCTRPSRAAIAAAEQMADAFADGRIFHAGQLLKQISPGRGDWRLEQLENEVNRRLGQAQQLIQQADRFADQHRFEQAADLYLQVLAAAADEPRLRDGLVHTAFGMFDANADPAARPALAPIVGPAPASSPGTLRATQMDDGVELVLARQRQSDDDRPGWTLLRLDCSTQTTQALADGWGSGVPFFDTAVRFGQEVRYAAVPYRNGLICGLASACGRIRYAPEVDEAVLRYTPQGVRLDWRRPAKAVSLIVLRSAVSERASGESEHTQIAVRAAAAGTDDFEVAPGVYEYVVRCGYPAPPDSPNTDIVWSAGLALRAVVKPWPTPVNVLRSELVSAQPLALRIDWQTPAVGTARLVPWQFSPREPGSDVSDLVAELQSALTGEEGEGSYRSAVVTGRPGETLRLTAISELDDRALAGPSILIQVIQAPAGLHVQRAKDASTAVVRFDWPEPAVLVSIRWEQDGLERRRTIPRSGYQPHGVGIAVNPSACQVTVEPLGRPDAQVFGSPASAFLPALPPAAVTLRRRLRRATRRVAMRVLRSFGRLWWRRGTGS